MKAPVAVALVVLAAVPAFADVGWLGAKLATPTADDKSAAGQPADARGALVMSVPPGSPAEAMGLRPGDLVFGLNGTPVDGAPAFAAAARKADVEHGVLVYLRRSGFALLFSFAGRADAGTTKPR